MPKCITLTGIDDGPYVPEGFELAQMVPADAVQQGEELVMDDGWVVTKYLDPEFNVTYLEYTRGTDNGVELEVYAAKLGEDLTVSELIDITQASHKRSHAKTWRWAIVGGVMGVIGGIMVASRTRKASKPLYGGMGLALGAGAASLLLAGIRGSQYPVAGCCTDGE